MNNLSSYQHQPKKNNPVGVALIILISLVLIVTVGAFASIMSDNSKSASAHPSSVAAAVAPPRAPAKDFFEDMYGQYKVGNKAGEVPAGTYKVTVTPDRGGGYWERCSNFECKISFGSDDSVITNKYLESGSAYLVIKPSDVAVTLEDLTLEAVK